MKTIKTSSDDAKRRLDILAGIKRGELVLKNGQVVSHEEAKKRMARWLE